jgi:transcriptional regulator with XRE-family HTH domain
MDLGARISAWLKTRGITQRQAAADIGVTPGAVTNWVKGDADPTQAHLNVLVEKVLGLTLVQFHGRIPKRRGRPS